MSSLKFIFVQKRFDEYFEFLVVIFFTNLTHCHAVLIYMCVILASPLLQELVALSMGGPRACSTHSWGPVLWDPAHIIWFFMRLMSVWVSNSKIALTSRFLGIRAEWHWSQRCVLSWILMTTADFILPPFSLSVNPLQKNILYLFFICMLCEFYWPQPKKVLYGFGFLAVYETVWNSGCPLKKWLPVTTSSSYLFLMSPFYTPASLNLEFISSLSF